MVLADLLLLLVERRLLLTLVLLLTLFRVRGGLAVVCRIVDANIMCLVITTPLVHGGGHTVSDGHLRFLLRECGERMDIATEHVDLPFGDPQFRVQHADVVGTLRRARELTRCDEAGLELQPSRGQFASSHRQRRGSLASR